MAQHWPSNSQQSSQQPAASSTSGMRMTKMRMVVVNDVRLMIMSLSESSAKETTNSKKIVKQKTPAKSYINCRRHDFHFFFLLQPNRRTSKKPNKRNILMENKSDFYFYRKLSVWSINILSILLSNYLSNKQNLNNKRIPRN